MNRTIIFFIIIIIAVIVVGVTYVQFVPYQTVSLADIEGNPQAYDGKRIMVEGLIVQNVGGFFGSKYQIAEADPFEFFDIQSAKKISMGQKSGVDMNIADYVTFTFDGQSYTLLTKRLVIVKGTVVYIGQVTDASPYHIELDSIETSN